ncbi:S8 family serine peptidase [Microbacterium sp. APC 3901]|uniref:S8 family peptidase n=1 Tax=Microbacterium sp. APC 3901 TaxID=3035192 RepID=UPI0025B4CC32|nr:S8 family serine peptidase [Microbacterium sp. APC 3901]MDN3444192.1 S8 family serine peptidase [Microbacterium sp. APC 3901]
MRSPHRLVAVLGAIALGAAIAAPASAAAEDLASGLWWFDRGNVQEAHDSGFDGSGVTVAVIDSQINPDAIGLRGADLQVRENTYCHDPAGAPIPTASSDYVAAGHGTNVVSMILGTGEAPAGGVPIEGAAPGATVKYYSAGLEDPQTGEVSCALEDGEQTTTDYTGASAEAMSFAISDAIDDGADIISISSGGYASVLGGVSKAIAAGVPIIASLPNEGGVGDQPAGLNGVVGVQAFGSDGAIATFPSGDPNLSDDVGTAAPGIGVLLQGTEASWDEQRLARGTSYATPIVSGFLAVVKQKYPDATGNQLLQSLIHNSGTKGEHEPEWNNSTGYGAASLTGMLAVDPTKYPDENPFFDPDDPNAFPNADDVAKAAADLDVGSTPEPTETSAAPDEPGAASAGVMPWVIGGGVVLLVGGIVLAVTLTRSSKRRTDHTGGQS